MARAIMGGDFRAIRKAPVAVEPVDPRLALVDLFVNGQSAPQGFIDLSSPLDSQEPAGAPVEDETENLAVEASEAADSDPVQPEPVPGLGLRVQVQDEQDYDPIAAVLG